MSWPPLFSDRVEVCTRYSKDTFWLQSLSVSHCACTDSLRHVSHPLDTKSDSSIYHDWQAGPKALAMKMLPQAFERLAVRHKQPRHSRRQGAAPMYSAADQAQRGGGLLVVGPGHAYGCQTRDLQFGGAGEVNEREVKPCRLLASQGLCNDCCIRDFQHLCIWESCFIFNAVFGIYRHPSPC